MGIRIQHERLDAMMIEELVTVENIWGGSLVKERNVVECIVSASNCEFGQVCGDRVKII
jgi:hypothetical protein